MGYNNLINYGSTVNQTLNDNDIMSLDNSLFIGVGAQINPSQTEIRTPLLTERVKIEKAFDKYISEEFKSMLFDCTVERNATLDAIDRYCVGDETVRISDSDFKIDYDSGKERVDVCVKLSAIMTWLSLGYTPNVYKRNQILIVYRFCREILNVYAEDPMSLVQTSMPDEVAEKFKNYVSYLEQTWDDVINPSVMRYDKPVSTFISDRFGVLFGSGLGELKTTSDGSKLKNGFIIDGPIEDEENNVNMWN